MPTKITQLKLTHFRGASGKEPAVVNFDPKKSMVMVFGENGTGKSTLVDAIDAVCNEDIGSIRRRRVGNAPWQHLPAIGADAKKLRVVLKTQGQGEYLATLSGKNVTVKAKAEGAGRPSVHVLRRSDLLQLVEATPADRYKALKAFVEVGGVEQSEQTLRTLAHNLKREYEKGEARKLEVDEALDEHWLQERQTSEEHPDAVAWAEARVSQDVDALRAEAKKLAAIEGALRTLPGVVARWKEAVALAEQAASQWAESKMKVGDAATADVTRPLLVGVLQAATGYLDTAIEADIAVEACPVCEQPVEPEALRNQSRSRLKELETLRRLIESAKVAEREAKAANEKVSSRAQVLLRSLRELADQLRGHTPAAIRELGLGPDQLDEALEGLEENAISEEVLGLAQQLTESQDGLLEEYDAIRSRVEIHDNTESLLARVKKNTANVEENFRLQERIEQALDIVEAKRRAYTERVLGEVRDEVNRLYERIHPDENIGLDRFEMDDGKRASLEQHARFEGHEGVKPQAYFSESHLDTFGFCLWLALAKRMSSGHGVLVLDDVFTSVDAPHFRRITDLLADEAESFRQLIIATHNRHWHEFYKRTGVGVHLVKLERWSIGRGIRAYTERVFTEDLDAALRADRFDRQAIASQAGILLEALLDDVALAFSCNLPRKHGHEHALGELLDGTRKKLRKAQVRRYLRAPDGSVIQPEQQEEIDVQPAFERVDALVFIRNEVGCHFNRKGLELADNDVEAFGRATLALARALACPGCGQIPSRKRGAHFVCRCKQHKTELEV